MAGYTKKGDWIIYDQPASPSQAAYNTVTGKYGSMAEVEASNNSSIITPEVDKVFAAQKEASKKDLLAEKDKDLSRLDDILAARGVSRGGGVSAGQEDIASRYARQIANVDAASNANALNYQLQKNQQDMMSKYYQALIDKQSAPIGGVNLVYGGEMKPSSWDDPNPNYMYGGLATPQPMNTTTGYGKDNIQTPANKKKSVGTYAITTN
jgi:hypothetical protein